MAEREVVGADPTRRRDRRGRWPRPAMSPPAPNHSSVPVRHTASSSGCPSAQIAARLMRAVHVLGEGVAALDPVDAQVQDTAARRRATMCGDPRSGASSPARSREAVDRGRVVVQHLAPATSSGRPPSSSAARSRAGRCAGVRGPGVLAGRVRVVGLVEDVVRVAARWRRARPAARTRSSRRSGGGSTRSAAGRTRGARRARRRCATASRTSRARRGSSPTPDSTDTSFRSGKRWHTPPKIRSVDAAHVVEEDQRRHLGEVRHPAHARRCRRTGCPSTRRRRGSSPTRRPPARRPRSGPSARCASGGWP